MRWVSNTSITRHLEGSFALFTWGDINIFSWLYHFGYTKQIPLSAAVLTDSVFSEHQETYRTHQSLTSHNFFFFCPNSPLLTVFLLNPVILLYAGLPFFLLLFHLMPTSFDKQSKGRNVELLHP